MDTENDTINLYADKYPTELRLALSSVDDKKSVAVLMVLVEAKNDEKNEDDGMRINEISETLDTNELYETIDQLQTGGLVEKRVGKRLGDPESGVYRITDFGTQLLDAVYAAGNPNVSQEEIEELSGVEP